MSSEYNVNEAGVKKALTLIRDGKVDMESDWSEAQPSADEENAYLEDHSYDEYGEWFLAIDTDASKKTKDRYNFPYGDFKKLHRDGLIAAKQRAAQYDHIAVEKAADKLLKELDGD